MFYFIYILYLILVIIQTCFGYGTAYRLAKTGGDNGVSLFGWLFLMSLAATVPGLGIYLWLKYRELSYDYVAPSSSIKPVAVADVTCKSCGKTHPSTSHRCPYCGYRETSRKSSTLMASAPLSKWKRCDKCGEETADAYCPVCGGKTS